MPPKKKGADAKKDPGDDSGERLFRQYRRNLQELGISMPKKLEEKFAEIRDEKNPGKLTDIIIWEPIGSSGVRALANALRDVEYKHTRNIRFWKANTEDEGVRAVCQFLTMNPVVLTLEFMECDMGPLGCEFISTLLGPDVKNPLQTLKLDHNNLGDLGVRNLAVGLSMNSTLQTLSLTYCNIESEGARGILEIVINQNSALKELDLQGNYLRNQGVCTVFHALQINKSLLKLNLADNQFGEDEQVLRKLWQMLANNATLQVLDLRFNGIFDTGAVVIRDMLRGNEDGVKINTTLGQLLLPENKISPGLMDDINKIVNSNKSKGKKSGKKKKGKKKK